MPLCLFWSVWWERNSKAIVDKENSIHRIKLIFFCVIFGLGLLFLCQGPPSIVDFVDWVQSD